MRKPNVLLRFLCGAADFLIILIPIQFVMIGIFGVSTRQADLFFQLLFAVYGTLMTEYSGGSLGKYFGKLQVADINGGKAPILYLGLRELTKSLYLIPYVGWAAGFASLVMMMSRKDGRTLHDFIGNTKIVYKWQFAREEEERS